MQFYRTQKTKRFVNNLTIFSIINVSGVNMRIKSFELGGHKIKVSYLKVVRDESKEMFGRFNPRTNVMEIALEMNGEKLSDEVVQHTFCHELGHAMMILMYEFELNANEKFIDNLGLLLHQFLKSAK